MLTPQQELVIREEYFSGTVARKLSTRACMLQYVVQDLRIAIDEQRERPPEFTLLAANAIDLKKYLF